MTVPPTSTTSPPPPSTGPATHLGSNVSASEHRKDDLGIKPGVVISNKKHNWFVSRLLGQGGFGAVYRVYDQSDKSATYAMKVEKKIERRKHSKLKMEVAILKDINGKPEHSKHFTSIVDRGKSDTYFYIVMTLVGKSLDDLKRENPNRVFSLGTGIGTGIQCLEAVAAMHLCGYIHRDLKPANYACGLQTQRRVIFLLDFGIARRITNDKNELKTPRPAVGFKGTVRFAALACHHNKEMGPKDDCESWFYLFIDITSPTGLPWKRCTDRNQVLKLKEELRTDAVQKTFLTDLSTIRFELLKILAYIDKLEYQDRVDYNFIYELLTIGAQANRINLDDPYDWEVKMNEAVSRVKAP